MRERGYVHAYDAFKGIGFIRRQAGRDVFFHFSALRNIQESHLGVSVQVEFDIENGPKGPKAINIDRVG